MKLSSDRSFFQNNTFLSFILITFLIAGGGLIASSVYRDHLLLNPDKDSNDTTQQKKQYYKDSIYRASMHNGDVYMSTKEYAKAITEFENGLKLKPRDPYANDHLAKAKALLEDKARAELDYVKAISSGDTYFKAKDYLNAKSAYQLAIDAKPDDAFAKGKLKETMDLLRSQKASNILYDVAVASAEKLFQQKEYEKAIAEFENAGTILPNEKYPKDRINEIIKIMVDKQTREEMYAKSIAAADKYYNAKGYQSALLEYRNAFTYKPEEQYPKDRIKELTALLEAMKARDEAYKKTIANADKLFIALSYEPSKAEYQNALKIKPEEAYPVDRIREIDEILARLKNVKAEYNRLVDLADSFYVDKKYINAKANYQQALKVKPDESYPKEMIAKSDNLISGQEANAKTLEEAYQTALTSADQLYTAKDYEKAKPAYEGASHIKPDESYPKEKIKEIEGILASIDKQNQQEKQYADLIAGGDKLFADKSFQPAKEKFQAALGIKPEEAYPKEKIGEIDKILESTAKQKALEDQYTAMIAAADKLFSDRSYALAKTQYQQALSLKPNEKYPKDRILEIDNALADLAKQKAVDDQYTAALSKADRSFDAKNWEQAKTDYNEASGIKPNETYPKDKIAEIIKIVADSENLKANEAKYAAILSGADKLLLAKSYDEAKTEYTRASGMKPGEAYPKDKISEIDKILADMAKKKSLDDQYASLITAADKFLGDKSYETAKTQYQSASVLKPEETYPKGKITEINQVLETLAKQKALDDQYTAKITAADKLFTEKSYTDAKSQYQLASTLKPDEKYPKDRITEIDNALKDLAKQKALDEQYAAAIAKADNSFAAKTWDQAKKDYGDASAVKPNEAYPRDKIAAIEKILSDLAHQKEIDAQYLASITKADQLLASKSYLSAETEYKNAGTIKPAEEYPRTKIAEIEKILGDQKAFEDKYNGAISAGDKAFGEKAYEQAKASFQAAIQMKPTEQYPKDKISAIDKILSQLAAQKIVDDNYNAAVTAADKLFGDKSYDAARDGYSVAGKIKPEEQYPKDKIAEIQKIQADIASQKLLDQKYQSAIATADKLLDAKSYDLAKVAYTDASGLKPAEQYPKDKIAAIDKILADIAHAKEIDAQYKSSIAKADQLLALKSYDPAETEYKNAGSLKPEEEYPKTKIAAIEKILNDQKAFEDKYSGAISIGDKAFGEKSYDQARAAYQTASQMKPAEKYPKDKIAEIDKLIAQLAAQKIIEDQYNASVAKADKLLGDKSFTLAKTEYGNALTIKPKEQYPKDKITEIDGILADLKAKDDAYAASVAKANQLMVQKSYEDARSEYQNAGEIKPAEKYPQEKISEINKILTELKGKRQTYDELVSKGNELYGSKDYYKAKDNFQQASGIFPDESYPKDRLARINTVIDSIFRANKGLYDKAVADGDKSYAAFEFDKAIDSYQEALSYLPMEQYAKDMINKIRKTIAENAIVDVLNTPQRVENGSEKQFSFTPVNIISRKNNYLYVKIRNLGSKPFNVMIRYGKDKQINGGVVMKNLAVTGTITERLISVREQDPWYRNDNNWISLGPLGGDIEVSFIQISRAGQ